MKLHVATSDLKDSIPSEDLLPSVLGFPYVMYHYITY